MILQANKQQEGANGSHTFLLSTILLLLWFIIGSFFCDNGVAVDRWMDGGTNERGFPLTLIPIHGKRCEFKIL